MLSALNATVAASGAGSSASGMAELSEPGAALTGSGGGSAPFADLLTSAAGHVAQLEDQARASIDGLMTGSGVDVHEAMIAAQKASMAFDLALAVRNKAVDAYQQVMGMQL